MNSSWSTLTHAVACTRTELPSLQVLECSVLQMEGAFETVDGAHDAGSALAAMLDSLPQLQLRIVKVIFDIAVDVSLELFAVVPKLVRDVQSLTINLSEEQPATKLDELLRLFPQLSGK